MDRTSQIIEAIRVLSELQDRGHTVVYQELRDLVAELMREINK